MFVNANREEHCKWVASKDGPFLSEERCKEDLARMKYFIQSFGSLMTGVS